MYMYKTQSSEYRWLDEKFSHFLWEPTQELAWVLDSIADHWTDEQLIAEVPELQKYGAKNNCRKHFAFTIMARYAYIPYFAAIKIQIRAKNKNE